MAARENQGLQIALIIFVMLTIVLIVTTYLFFSNYSDQRDKAKALTQENSDKDTKMRQAIAETDDLKNMVGAAQTEGIDAVKENANKEFQAHGEGLPDSKQNYRALVEHLVTKLRKYEAANTDLAAQLKELNDKLKTNDKAALAEVAQYTAKLTETAADLDNERKTFGADRDTITGQKDQLAARFETTRRDRDKLSQKSTERISTLTSQLARAEQLLNALRNKEGLEEKANEFPDGRVTHVNQRTRLVWLNVGPADGLRRRTSFVIVAPEDGNPIQATPKGSIEVVRLTGPHQAEARIVDDDLSNPIMPGDNIFSVVWEAGRAEHFALAGKMDIDGDGEDDQQQIRALIALNGGIVDAVVTEDGTRTGEMTINTKYLVRGDEPGVDSKDRAAYGKIYSEAQSLGVNTMTINEFLDHMGYKDDYRTVNLGRSARPADFKPRLPDGVQRVLPGSIRQKDLRKQRGAKRSAP